MTSGIYLLLGTNLGDRNSNLTNAKQGISSFSNIITQSSIYETKAWGKLDQPSFYNQVIEIETKLAPPDLLFEILNIEKKLGRVRYEKWGIRIIDIDILYFGGLVFENSDLKIPHPGIPDRRFTLEPLSEIAPDFIHPVLKKSNIELLNKTSDQLEVNKLVAPS
jgi:2-amino-4-hydroxy-6-hydroxymethyldihydropteridine diphosphokinase